LKALVADEHYDVVGVVTQPDRPAGRKMQMQPSAIKNYCLAHGLRVISPESVNSEAMLQQLDIWGAEVAVVVAFGQLLGERFLNLFPLGAVNVHGSILPRWRGAAPIQRSIEFGDKETGVTLQKVVKKLDAGDVLGVRKMVITEDTDAQLLYAQMANLGAELLQVELMDYVRGNLAGEVQDQSLVTYAKKIEKAEGEIQWNQSAEQISRKVRAFTMGPGTWTNLEKMKIKIHKVRIIETDPTNLSSGTLVKAENSDVWVQTGEGILALIEVQPESRNRISAPEFLKGYALKVGLQFEGVPNG
jgi:methionyl-tRNA formyltransferase